MVLTHIFHLSDLHIRNGDNTYSRYEEYKEVFKNTIVSIKKQIEVLELSFDNFIIVITGDIFHNKSVIGNYGLIMYRKFIQALSDIGRTYIISGNHDYDQSDINKPSLVYSTTFAIPNVFVLNTTTSFIIDEIGISFVSIDETLDNYRNSGRLQDLPPFPSISGDVRFKLALFHGSFAAAKLYNGKTVEDTFNPYPLEWVSDFDYVLLGDIHKRQVFSYKNKTICGYAGSLIQQNFGEDIVNHGYLIWDIYNKDIKKVNVYNDKGFINIRESESSESSESSDNKDIMIRINGKYEKRLEDYIIDNIDIIPKNLDIKMFSNINIFNLKSILEKYNIKYVITEKVDNFNNFKHNELHNSSDTSNIIDTDISSSCNEEIINNDALINYFKPLLTTENLSLLNKIIKNKELLLIDVENYPEELREECLKINKELMAVINTCNITDDTTIIPKSLYKIRYLEWEGLLCYENKNWLNMANLDSKIFMVKGQNGTGKSAIYDILLLAIWGENTKKNQLTSGVVNHNKSKGYTIIEIDVLRDSANAAQGTIDTYRIVRNYTRKNACNKLLVSNTVIYKKIANEAIEIIKKDTACNNEITRLFGNMEDFLATSMITQNIDCDILKMDFKSTLELIDKSFNIEYIYNLYNVFNKTINKYKGLHKYIESKKDVYEKLLLTSNYTENYGVEIEKMKEDLELLKNINSSLIEEYNSNNSILSNRNIELSTYACEKYEGLKNIINLEKLVSHDIYDIKVKRLAELEFILKGKDIITLSKAHIGPDIYDKEDIAKPCDISIINNENKYLKEYFDIFDDNNSKYNTCDENDVIESLVNLRNEYDSLEILAKSLISEKPNKATNIDKPIKAKKECLNNIKQLFGSIECMEEIMENIEKVDIKLSPGYGPFDGVSDIVEDLSFESYKKFLEDRVNLKNKIDDYNNRLKNNETIFNKCFKEQENIKIVSAPATTTAEVTGDINCDNFCKVMEEIEKIDYNYIVGFLKDNEESLEEYKDIMTELREAEEDRLKYADELMLFENNEEYHFNPSCEYCCKRSWVGRIKELRIIIERYDKDIDKIKNKLNINVNYKELIYKMETYKCTKDRYEILQEWYEYFKYKELRNKLSEKLNKLIENKKKYNKIISDATKELEKITKNISLYYKKARELRERLNNIVNYEKYRVWETQYNENTNKINDIDKNMKEYTDIANYNKNIKQRIIAYRSLVDSYNKWERYNNYINIIHSREYLEIKEIQENYRNNEIYKTYNEVKPIIERVLELKEIINESDKTIIKQRDYITEKAAIFNYNSANIKSLNELQDILKNINNMLTILDTIIINFQDFRINLYDNVVLKKLLCNTNNMLKNICHSITKPFELDYITNVSRDMIHINWLIKNVNISSSSNNARDNNKQIISINQASGFQQFVISLALRLCLFGNNKAICKQLYIDEGFVSFDKYNLSIVPNFIKSLLAYFDTIVIVSHIDLIQDSIDDSECIAEINYNNKTSVSTLTYSTPIDIECSYVGKKKTVGKRK